MMPPASSLSTSPYVQHHQLLQHDVTTNGWMNGETDDKLLLANGDYDFSSHFGQQIGEVTGHAPFTEMSSGYRLQPVCIVSIE